VGKTCIGHRGGEILRREGYYLKGSSQKEGIEAKRRKRTAANRRSSEEGSSSPPEGERKRSVVRRGPLGEGGNFNKSRERE